MRKFLLFLLILTSFVLFSSYYFEYILGLHPCPLCLMQRFCVCILLLGLIYTFFCQVNHKNLKKILLVQSAVSLAGVFFAGRQLWLQNFAAGQESVCLPGFKLMMHYLPWQEVMHNLLLGAPDCATISWTFLGLSIAFWTFIYFLGMFFSYFFIFLRFYALHK